MYRMLIRSVYGFLENLPRPARESHLAGAVTESPKAIPRSYQASCFRMVEHGPMGGFCESGPIAELPLL